MAGYYDCCYCGEPGTCLDHVIPVSYNTNSRKRKNKTTGAVNKQQCVGACNECNALLSNYFIPTIAGRAEYLSDRLAQRYHRVLVLPYWSEEEIQELGRNQRSYVIKEQLERSIVLDRIRHCNTIALLEDMSIADYWDKQPY